MEKEINITETNSKICSCGADNHEGNFYLVIKNFKLDSDEQNEINKITDLCNDSTIKEKKNIFKEKIINLIKGKNNDKILQIICNMLNIIPIKIIFNTLDYKDDIYSKIFSCLKESPNYSSYNTIMCEYTSNYFFNKISIKESPIYVFKDIFPYDKILPALYYYNPGILSHSFFFQVYRKKIISKNIESNDFIYFLRSLGINNEILCSHMIVNPHISNYELYTYGFFTLDSISKVKVKELTTFKKRLEISFIYIVINQICEIFSDFIYNGDTKRISLLDKSNYFSNILIQSIFDNLSKVKNNLIIYPLFKLFFYEENKQRIITLLSSYSFSISHQQNIFKDSDEFLEIFNLIENEVKNILNEKKLRKNDSQQNILIVKKLLDLYQLKYNNIEELYLYDFNNLLQNIIEKDYPIKLVNKALELIPITNDKKSLQNLLDCILKITLLCCTNIVGGTYIYNSNFIPKIIEIIKNLNFNNYSNFILEMLIILKICFNRKIIDISFLRIKNEKDDITVKEYLIDMLFVNEPIINNESMYNFNFFKKLLNRINTIYSFIFEKTNIKILPDSFNNINFEDSYLNIIKIISLNMNEEFNQMKWKNEKMNLLQLQEDKKIIEKNENNLEKKIKEEITKIKTKIPGFILIDLLRCLENLNQTNFYLKYDEKSYLNDDKFDLTSIIVNDKLPLAVKSLLLNYLLKLVLSLKIDPNSNKIYGPLVYTSSYEKNPNPLGFKIKRKELITLESNESEKHLNETLKLINILIICIELLKKRKNTLNFEKAFIEKNGLYDYCVSIIQALFCLSNLIVNTNKIHEIYLSSFSKLAFKFFEIENIFMEIINKEIEHKKIIFDFNKKFDYKENMLIVVDINRIIAKYVDKINFDSNKFTDRKLTSIYQSFIDYHNGLNITKDNHYLFIFSKKENEKITLEELNEFNGIDSNINEKILNNYNKWKKYINNESSKIKALIDKNLNLNRGPATKRENFYSFIFIYIANLGVSAESQLNDHLFLKSLISIIMSDEQFKSICNDDNFKIILKNYINNKDIDLNDFKARIIGQIIRKIYFLTNYELLISQCFSNTKQENEISELLNSLILFLEIFGEHLNQFFYDSMFKYKFDLSIGKDNTPVAKYDEESKTFKMLKEDVEEKNVYSPFEVLLELHQKIFESLKITIDDKYRETQQNNLLIILNSLTYCIIEYTNLENPYYKPIIEKLYLQYFFWQRKDKSLNPIFQSINFEIGVNMSNKNKYIFIINNILSLFIYYIKYGTKEMNKNYFYELQYYLYNPYLYLFHVFVYTLQIINDLDKNVLNSKNSVENIIDLYKKTKFKNNQLFNVAQKYYELIFLIKTYYGYNELKAILPDDNEKPIKSNKIMNYFLDREFYTDIINDIIINDDSIDDFKIYRDNSESMNIIFSFWRQIFIDIEICIGDKNQNSYFLIRPESLYLSGYEKKFYDDIIDYSSRDSKLMGLYENLDSFLFEMVSNFYYDRFNLAKVFSYFGLELMNILLFIIHNIILLIHYYKSWKEEDSIYNKIENNKTSIILLILSGIHILYNIAIIINWIVNNLIIDYFQALSKYSIQNKYENYKLHLSTKERVLIFRKIANNYTSKISVINEFFPGFTILTKTYILIVKTIILNSKVFPFMISLICLILYYFLSEIFLIVPLLLIANLIPTLSAIFKSLINKLKYLIFIYSYTLIVLYIFSWIGFFFLPNLFKFEVVNNVDQNEEKVEEYMCSSSIQCILYFLNFGLSSGGSLDLELISFKNNYGFYLRQFFFDIFFFLFINMIFSNVFLALITDAFSEMRELAWKNENDKVNVCFICDLNKSDCNIQKINFKTHIRYHLKWKYINLMCKMILEEDVELSKEEYYIQNLMKKRSIYWFPNKK